MALLNNNKLKDSQGNVLPMGMSVSRGYFRVILPVGKKNVTASSRTLADAKIDLERLKAKHWTSEEIETLRKEEELYRGLPPRVSVRLSKCRILVKWKEGDKFKSVSGTYGDLSEIPTLAWELHQLREDTCKKKGVDITEYLNSENPFPRYVLWVAETYIVATLRGNRHEGIGTYEEALCILEKCNREHNETSNRGMGKVNVAYSKNDQDLPVGVTMMTYPSNGPGKEEYHRLCLTLTRDSKYVFSKSATFGPKRSKLEALGTIISARDKFLKDNPEYLEIRNGRGTGGEE